MVDDQFLGTVALGLAVVTRGALQPVLAMTAMVVLVILGYETAARRWHGRHDGPSGGRSSDPTDVELTRWMTVMDRVLRSRD